MISHKSCSDEESDNDSMFVTTMKHPRKPSSRRILYSDSEDDENDKEGDYEHSSQVTNHVCQLDKSSKQNTPPKGKSNVSRSPKPNDNGDNFLMFSDNVQQGEDANSLKVADFAKLNLEDKLITPTPSDDIITIKDFPADELKRNIKTEEGTFSQKPYEKPKSPVGKIYSPRETSPDRKEIFDQNKKYT